MNIKRNVIAILLALSVLVTSVTALAGGLTAAADAIATRGDVNGDGAIDMKDVLLLRKFIANVGDPVDEIAADANGDGAIDMKDVLLLRKFIANMDVTLAPMPDVSEPSTEPESEPESAPESTPVSEAESQEASKAPTAFQDAMNPDQITLTYYDEACTQYGVTWHTYAAGTAPTVQMVKGRTTDAADFADATVIAGDTTAYDTKTMPYDEETNTVLFTDMVTVKDYVHRAVLSGLDFDTAYSYRVGDADANKWSAIATFTTREEAVSGFSFIEITDTQNSMGVSSGYTPTHQYMRAALESAFSKVEDPAFILHGGDFVEASMLMDLWRSMLNGNQDFLMSTPLMMVCGNHDSTYKSADYEQIKHFNVGVDTAHMNTKLGIYYSYDYGNAHFVVLNSNSTGKRTDGTTDNVSIDKAQYEWLKADLEANTQEWTIVTLHHPIFAPVAGSAAETAVRQEQLLGLFNDNHVDLVIQSHEHLYLRTHPIGSDGKPIKDTPTTTVNGVTCLEDPGAPIFFCAGKTSKSGDAPYGDYDESLYAKTTTGQQSSYSIITIEGNTLTVTANYVYSGQLRNYESFGIVHTAG